MGDVVARLDPAEITRRALHRRDDLDRAIVERDRQAQATISPSVWVRRFSKSRAPDRRCADRAWPACRRWRP
jgi:hypothetical protein